MLGAIFPEPIMIVGKDISTRKIDGTLNTSSPTGHFYKKGNSDLDPSARICLGEVIDTLGAASAKAQGLLHPVTTHQKLRSSDNHVVYIMTRCLTASADAMKSGDTATSGDTCLGYLKVGRRQLYLADRAGVSHVVTALCLFDFYVHESVQRQGHGAALFKAMLKNEDSRAELIAVDKPSNMMLSFLAKHYQLTDPIKQNNSYVVYEDFFSSLPKKDDETKSAESNGSSMHHRIMGVEDSHDGTASAKLSTRNGNGSAATTGALLAGTAAGKVSASQETRNLHDHHQLW